MYRVTTLYDKCHKSLYYAILEYIIKLNTIKEKTMRRFIEKSIITSLALYSTYKFFDSIDFVFFFLISIFISTSLDLIKEKKYRYIFYFIFLGLVFYNNTFLYYLPLIFYNLYLDFGNYSLFSLFLILINFSPIILIITFLSLYFSHSTNTIENMVSEYRLKRDSMKEDTLFLKKYNEQLTLDREKNIHIAILTERNRIAREIHDSIGHSISSSILQVQAIKTIGPKVLDQPLNQLQSTLNNGMNDIRQSLQGLRDESLDLKSRIENLIDEIPSLEVEFLYNIEEELDYNLKFDILSIVKEAITNTVKHGNATKLKINLISQPKFYTFIIEDNGLEEPNFDNKGIGLDYIRETTNKYNGIFNYKYNKGFKIHITLMKGK